MAINISNQYIYKGKGPFDAKSLVKTYADLTNVATWTVEDSIVAYNGMIVAVWLDKTPDMDYNGIYYLYDANVTSTRQSPDTTNSANWHKISDKIDLSGIESALQEHDARLAALETEEKLHTYGYRSSFPSTGKDGHMYIAVDEKKTYVWANETYIPVGGSDYEEPTIIDGGSAD